MIALFKAKGGGGRRFYFVMKRLLDVMVSGLAMLVLFPVLAPWQRRQFSY